MNLKQLVFGLISYVPGLSQFHAKGTGGTVSARYCYSVWLRHLIFADKNSLNTNPKVVAELGPGDSLGIGFAALLSGSEKYYALDIVEHASTERNLKLFDELVSLFENREDIPGDNEFPNVKPKLDNYRFPEDILTQARLAEALNVARIKKIRTFIRNQNHKDSLIKYKVPWFASDVVENKSVDMIYSQAVLEHVDDLKNTYRVMHLWLKPHGFISHQIDFKCHGSADEWNGHWTYSDFMWKFVRGRRPYFLNREPHSTHIKLLKEQNFKILCDITVRSESNINRDDLAKKFIYLSDDDIVTSGAFIQALPLSKI